MIRLSVTAGLVLFLFAASCTSPVKNKIFTSQAPSSPEYRQELSRVFLNEGSKNLTFYFKELVNLNSQNYIKLDVAGAGINAQALVLINNWQKLEGIRRTKGVGYSGAELKNLKLEITMSKNAPIFTYRNLDEIID